MAYKERNICLFLHRTTNHAVIRLEAGQGVLIKGNRFEILALEDKK